MLILDGSDVRQALPMRVAIDLMKRAFVALSRGDAAVPPRAHLAAPGTRDVTLVMPARVDDPGDSGAASLAVKVVSVFGDNPGRGLARIQGAVIVLEPDTGRPLALVEGSSLTAIRTAAASGAATDLLARPASRTLAVLGAGVQALGHIEAVCAVREIETIRVYGPTPRNVDGLIERVRSTGWTKAEVSRADTAAAAVRGADVICATTTSSTPVMSDADIDPGAHINAVGSYTPDAREIAGATVGRSWVAVDDRQAAWAEAGELIQARAEGFIDESHVRADLGELVLDDERRPRDPGQVTLFKSVGVAVQDAVAAAAAVERASRLGLGVRVDWAS